MTNFLLDRYIFFEAFEPKSPMGKGALCPNSWRKRSIPTQSRRFNPSTFEVKNGLENGALPFIFAKKTAPQYSNSLNLLFQFHKGSINTVKLSIPNLNLSPFQFHEGSINTGLAFQLTAIGAYFNSMKVRLILVRSI